MQADLNIWQFCIEAQGTDQKGAATMVFKRKEGKKDKMNGQRWTNNELIST